MEGKISREGDMWESLPKNNNNKKQTNKKSPSAL